VSVDIDDREEAIRARQVSGAHLDPEHGEQLYDYPQTIGVPVANARVLISSSPTLSPSASKALHSSTHHSPQRQASLSISSHNPSKRQLHDRISTSITHTTLPHPRPRPTPLIPHKPKTPHPLPPLPAPLPHLLHPRHHDPNRMPSTNRIPRLLQRLQPRHMAPTLARAHALEIHAFDRLMDRGIPGRRGGFDEAGLRGAGGAVEGVGEAEAPVCEVGGDYEGGGGVCEVGGEKAAEEGLGGDGGVAY